MKVRDATGKMYHIKASSRYRCSVRKRKGPGRPTLPRGAGREVALNVRFRPDERRQIEAAARAAEESLSDWARRVLFAAADEETHRGPRRRDG